MLGHPHLEWALDARPRHIANVTPEHFERLSSAYAAGSHQTEFETAWENGSTFARATEGLRGRPPWTIEWKGQHKPPGYEQIPADLRVDHVYLISCKYGSAILHNVSPAHVFDLLLVERPSGPRADWFVEVAPEAYQELYDAARAAAGVSGLPARVAELGSDDRKRLKRALPARHWPDEMADVARGFAAAVSYESAQRWRAQFTSRKRSEELLWRLLRLQAAPYFVLGAAPDRSPLRYRVATPWDFRDRYELLRFDAWPDAVGQPVVRWRADVVNRASGREQPVEGHVEVRWSHGRFAGMPEAKVKLDTPHHDVAGYLPLE
jgi:hypothetical protein